MVDAPDERALDNLNAFWDAVVLGEAHDPTGLPAGISATVGEIARLKGHAMVLSTAELSGTQPWSSNGLVPPDPVDI